MAKQTKPNDDKPVGVNLSLPRDLHRAVKAAAALRGMTIQAATVEALRAWTAKQAPRVAS